MKYAIILAGGSGLRAGGEIPKQFQLLHGLPVLWWSVKAFHEADPATRIRLVLHPGFLDLWNILFEELPEEEKTIPVDIVCGGRDRLESVKNGLMGIEDSEGLLIAVHDAARPLVSKKMISAGWEKAHDKKAAVPVVPMTDSIRQTEGGKSIALNRSLYVRVQTPQVFDGRILREAYSRPLTPQMTDDASVVEAIGISIALYPGEETNMKITNPLDLQIASLILSEKKN